MPNDRRDFFLKRGDTLPAISGALKNADGSVVDLTGATVVLKIRRADLTAAAVSRTATVVSASAGTVSYAWVAGDVATPGDYLLEWVVTFPSTKVATYPGDGYLMLHVLESL